MTTADFPMCNYILKWIANSLLCPFLILFSVMPGVKDHIHNIFNININSLQKSYVMVFSVILEYCTSSQHTQHHATKKLQYRKLQRSNFFFLFLYSAINIHITGWLITYL